MTGSESFPEPVSWNGSEDSRYAEPGMEVNPFETSQSDERPEPDVAGMASDYETRKREALSLIVHSMGTEDLRSCIETLWEAIYSDFTEPSDSIWASLRAWGIEWTQIVTKP